MIYSDNFNTVSLFSLLHALPGYNTLLTTAVDLLCNGFHGLGILYVPSEENMVADALSRLDLDCAMRLCPSLHILEFFPYVRLLVKNHEVFLPPRDLLGATLL